MTTLSDVAAAAAELAPPELAEEWDNVGLLVGDPEVAVRDLWCCLDLTESVLDEIGPAAAVVAFHPPLFQPLSRLRADDPGSRRVWRAARDGVGIVSTHTALDNARPGTSDWLAAALDIEVEQVLRPRAGSGLVKIVSFVPLAAADAVAAAMSAAGAGRIGDYVECSFRGRGTGTFRGLPGATPAVGQSGRLETVDEIRLEMLCPVARQSAVVEAMVEAHPYEEVAHDVYPLANRSGHGLGRCGRLAEAMPLEAFAGMAMERLGASGARIAGDLARPVARVAVMGGSGAGFVADAARAGADVLVTGDIKHHDALEAERLGLAVIDPGHAATEQPAVAATADFLARRLDSVAVRTTRRPPEPMTWRR